MSDSGIVMNSSKNTLHVNNEKVTAYKKSLKTDFTNIETSLKNMQTYFNAIANDKGTGGQVKTTMQKAAAALKTVGEKNQNWNNGLGNKIDKVVQSYANSVLGTILNDLATSASDLSKIN